MEVRRAPDMSWFIYDPAVSLTSGPLVKVQYRKFKTRFAAENELRDRLVAAGKAEPYTPEEMVRRESAIVPLEGKHRLWRGSKMVGEYDTEEAAKEALEELVKRSARSKKGAKK